MSFSVHRLVIVTMMVLSITLSQSAFSDVNEGLVAHYEFEGNANDSSGIGNHGTEYGGVSYTSGVIGQAAGFDGADDYIHTAGNLNLNKELAVSVWVKTPAEISNGQNLSTIISKYNWNGQRSISFYSRTAATSAVMAIVRSDDNLNNYSGSEDSYDWIWSFDDPVRTDDVDIEFINPTKLNDNEWQHLLVNVDDEYVYLYVSGLLASKLPRNTDNIFNADEPLYIGNTFNGGAGSNNHYNGLMDELRIYNRALSESEIQSLYNIGVNGSDSGSPDNSISLNTDLETVLDWAEELYPNLFPSNQATKTSGGSYYREYPQTGIRVTVADDGKVYLKGGEFGSNQSYVGELDFFYSQAIKSQSQNFTWNSGDVYGSFESTTSEYDHNFSGFLARYLNTFNWEDKDETILKTYNEPGDQPRSYTAEIGSNFLLSGGRTNIQFHVATQYDTVNSQEVMLLMFEGSNELSDWVNDIQFGSTDFRGNSGLNTHSGITRIFDFFIDYVFKDPNIIVSDRQRVTFESYFNSVINGTFQPKVILAGHSLGGALATLTAAYLVENGYDKDHLQVYTWGAPPIAKNNFAYEFSHLSIHNIVNTKDVVPATTRLCGDYESIGNNYSFTGTSGSFDWESFEAGCTGMGFTGIADIMASYGLAGKLLGLGPGIISRESHGLYCSYIRDNHPEWYFPDSCD